MPRLRRKAGIRSERHGAKRRARERRYRSKSDEPWAICRVRRTWERARATAMARQRRACCEAVGEGEPPKGGEADASEGGAKRRAAMRVGKASGRAAGDGSGATEPRRRSCTGLAARTRKRSAQRAPASVGARDRHPKGEDRVSGLRGAGRGEAAPGGIEPGDRSEGPGGRPYFPTRRADDTGPNFITDGDD